MSKAAQRCLRRLAAASSNSTGGISRPSTAVPQRRIWIASPSTPNMSPAPVLREILRHTRPWAYLPVFAAPPHGVWAAIIWKACGWRYKGWARWASPWPNSCMRREPNYWSAIPTLAKYAWPWSNSGPTRLPVKHYSVRRVTFLRPVVWGASLTGTVSRNCAVRQSPPAPTTS